MDILIKGGRVIDPGQGIDRKADVAFADGKVLRIDDDIAPDNAKALIDASDRIVTPGLIDLHTHVYWGGTSIGIEADSIARRAGTTTFVDAGTAGPANFLGFRRHVIEHSRARILAFLNISFAGIYAFSAKVMVGECDDIRLCDPAEVVRVARDHLDLTVGVKVRVGKVASGADAAPYGLARIAGEELSLPVMTHLDLPPPTHADVVPTMKQGDILTHCFRPFPNAPIISERRIKAEVLAARERGVIFDIGHGMGSFSYDTAQAMMREGFMPDVISSDVHSLCVHGPAYDLLVTLSKFVCLDMPLPDVIRAATVAPADAIRRPELGTLTSGTVGDASVLELREGAYDYIDSTGKPVTGNRRLFCDGVVIDGQWWPNDG
ncbi:MAG: amidohydrolase/deacetylase family metallohydrolase [Alphaproteobacteria bacterium]